MHKSPNLAPQANPQLYKVFCVLQILGCICLSRLERSNFRTEPPSATIFGMPYKKNTVVKSGVSIVGQTYNQPSWLLECEPIPVQVGQPIEHLTKTKDRLGRHPFLCSLRRSRLDCRSCSQRWFGAKCRSRTSERLGQSHFEMGGHTSMPCPAAPATRRRRWAI